MATVQWQGDKILDITAKAAIEAVDETDILCVQGAVADVHVITAVLQGGIDYRPAERVDRTSVVGQFGVYGVNYAIYEEILHPFLRPQADRQYPKVGDRLAKNMRGKVK